MSTAPPTDGTDTDLSPTERREMENTILAVSPVFADREELDSFTDAGLAKIEEKARDRVRDNLDVSDSHQSGRTEAGEHLSDARVNQLQEQSEAMGESRDETGGETSGVPPWLQPGLARERREESRANVENEEREALAREQERTFHSLGPAQQAAVFGGESTDPDVERVRSNLGLTDDGPDVDPADRLDLPNPNTVADPVERAHVRHKREQALEDARTNAAETRETTLKTPDEYRSEIRDQGDGGMITEPAEGSLTD
jgi:hypothetical protein